MLRQAKEASDNGKMLNPDSRSVFVGLSQIQRSTAELVAKSMHLNAHFCDTLEEGQEWLVREDDKRRKG